MAKLKNYNGRYCEAEYEYAFIGFLEAENWKYSSGSAISRATKRDVLIADDFKKFIAGRKMRLLGFMIMCVWQAVKVILPLCTRCMAGWLTAFSLYHRTDWRE